MLAIYIHGEKESGFLDLAPDSQLDMEETNPAFDEDLSIGEFSLPYEGILWTENNRRLLLFAERTDQQSPVNVFTCTVYDNNLPEITKGKLTLLSKNGNLNFKKGRFSASISGSKGMYGSLIAKKKLTDLTLSGRIEWSGMDSREFAQDVMDNNPPDYWFLSFSPVAIEGFIDEQRADYDGEFLARNCVNNLVGTVFGRPLSSSPSTPASSGDPEYLDYRTVPFFRLNYVLKKCFEEFGYRITGEFINDPLFYNLVIFNNYGIEKYDLGTSTDTNRSLLPANHLPETLIAEFLKSVLGFFGLFPLFEGDNSIRLIYRKTELASSRIKNVDHIVNSDFESTYEDGAATSGYRLSYQWDSDDSFYSDRVNDITGKTMAATVTLYSQLLTLDIGRSFTVDDIVLVESENMYYSPADATVLPVIKWNAWGERLHDYVEGEGEQSNDYGLSTLCQYVEFNETDGVTERMNYLGTRQPGSYTNNRSTLVKSKFGLRIFYSAVIDLGGLRPMSFNHSRVADGSVSAKYSLAWMGDDGIATNFHTYSKDRLMNKELVKLIITPDSKDLEEIRSANIISAYNTYFLKKRLERSIPQKGVSTLYLVPL